MATNPAFAATPRGGVVAAAATANAARDGTGTMTSIVTAGASGTKIEELRISATATTTAGNVKIFICNGATQKYLTEVAVTAITPSATVLPFLAILTFDNLILPSGSQLLVAPHNAEAFNIGFFGGDF